jgi:hypothetical protein
LGDFAGWQNVYILSAPGCHLPRRCRFHGRGRQGHLCPYYLATAQIDREVDEAKRKTLVSQAEAILEQDPPLLPVSWEKINDSWYNYVKGHNPYNYFGRFDMVRFDTLWLDT